MAHERAVEMLLATPPDEMRRAMEMTDKEIASILGIPQQDVRRSDRAWGRFAF